MKNQSIETRETPVKAGFQYIEKKPPDLEALSGCIQKISLRIVHKRSHEPL